MSRFCSYELRTTDVDAARAFYEDVVGAVPPIVRLPWAAAARGAPAHWLGHVGVPDVGAIVKRFIAEGGERLGPMQSTDDGAELAVLRDPFGSVVGVRPSIDDVPPSVVCWHQLHTHDQEQAFSFYSDVFGWRGVDALAKGDERYLIFAWDSVAPPVGTIANSARHARVHPHWLYYFSVPDLDRSLARASELGGELLDGPRRLPRGTRLAVCHDPQGAEFGLRQQAS